MYFRQLALAIAGILCATTLLRVEAADKNAWRKRSVYQYAPLRYTPDKQRS